MLLPRSVDEVCAELAARPDAELLAGGTDLMVGVNAGRHPVGTVIALDRVDDLRGWRRDGDQRRSAPGVTYAELLPARPGRAGAGARPGRPHRRLPPDPQRRHHRRQPGHRLPGRRHPAGAWPRSTPWSSWCSRSAAAASPDRRVLRRSQAHRARAGRAHRRRPRAGRAGPPGVPQGGGPQRHGHRRGRRWRWWSTATAAPSGSGWARSARRRCGPPRPRRGSPASSTGTDAGRSTTPPSADRSAELVAAAARPIDDHRSTAAVPAPRVGVLARRALLRMTAAVTVAATEVDRLHAAGQRHRARGRRRLAGREPALRAARAPRACPGPRTAASRASAARARSCVDGVLVCSCLVLAAAAVDRPRSHRRGPAASRRACCRTCSRPSSTPAPCSAGSARPGWSWRCTTCSTADPAPDDLAIREAITGNLCRCTGYGRILEAVRVGRAPPAGRGS